MAEWKIGFVGIGIMGESMCANVVKAGYEVWAYDLDAAQVQKMVDLGAHAADSVADVGQHADVVIIMVPNNDNVRDVITNLLPHLRPGTTVIDMSTISPSVSREMAEQVVAAGGRMIDAPVVKSKSAAISGDLGVLVGGDPAIFEEMKPLLQVMGKNVIRMGPNGAGLVMKLCHNSLVAEIQNGVNEMLVLARAAGIDFDAFVKAISYGGGQNFYLDGKWQTIKDRDFAPKFPFEHMHKDVNLTKHLAGELNLDLPGLRAAIAVFDHGMDENLNREDFSASFKIVEERAKE